MIRMKHEKGSSDRETMEMLSEEILKHPVKTYFKTHMFFEPYIHNMNESAALFFGALKGFAISLWGLLVGIAFAVFNVLMFIFSPIAKVIWLMLVRRDIKLGRFENFDLEERENEDT